MPSNTPNFGLYKKDPVADGNDTFNIETMLNENWDKIDAGAVKKGPGIAELLAGLLSARPDPGVVGRYYFARDTGEIYLDTGEVWILAAASNAELAAHKAETMPHRFTDGVKMYRWGLAVIGGVVNMVYEEVV